MITKNLLSVSKFAQDNHVFFEFHPRFCLVKDLATQTIILHGTLHDGLYKFDLEKPVQNSPFQSPTPSPVNNLDHEPCHLLTARLSSPVLTKWHLRLGHPTPSVVKQILLRCNIPLSRNEVFSFCNVCELGKSHQLSFSPSNTSVYMPLELICCDVWGPAHTISTNGSRYYLSFVDTYTRYTWIYFLKLKSEVTQVFMRFKTHVELQFNAKIKRLQSDSGGEFKSFNSLSSKLWHHSSFFLPLHL